MELDRVVAVRTNKTIYRSGDKLVKIFNDHYSKSGILNEALNLARIEETGLNVSKLQEVTKIDGKWALVLDYINGKSLDRLIHENPNKIDEYMEIFVNTQMEIHSKQARLLTILNDKVLRKLEDTDLDNIVKYDIQTKLASFEQHNKVLHGDYQFSNVIIGDDNKIYVIDWSHATQGNASADVAMSYLQMVLNNSEDVAKKYLEIYSQKSGTSISYIKSWIPIVASTILNSCEKSQEETLRKFIEVVEY